MLKIVVGKSVEGENFFGREREIAALGQMVETDHVLLLAPRRVGKSSLLRALPDRPRTDGLVPVYADVQDCRGELRFVETILAAIYASPAGRPIRPGAFARWRARRKSRVKSVHGPGGVGVELESVSRDWQAEADHAFDRLLAHDQRWLVLVDELPNVVVALDDADPSGGRVRGFLAWFRRLRQRPDADARLRFVLCGSIGLDNVARRYGISDTINDLRVHQLGPFDRDTATAFLDGLARSYGWSLPAPVRERILREVEWLIPHHLQGVMGELQQLAPGVTLEEHHVATAVERLLVQRTYFNSWDERLTPSLGAPFAQYARAILLVCARDPDGAARATVSGALATAIPDPTARAAAIAELVPILSYDGYLVEAGERLRFRSSLLRRYWTKHFT